MKNLVLSYHDALLYKSDIRILEDPREWLNDAVIHFQMMRYQCNEGNVLGWKNPPKHKLIFIDPAVISFIVHQCDNGAPFGGEETLQCLKSNNIVSIENPTTVQGQIQQAIFCPINDTNDASELGRHNFTSSVSSMGSHWSLLVIVIVDHRTTLFYHFDSSDPINQLAATTVANKIASSLKQDMNLINCETPIQPNCYDCGIYCLAITKILAIYILGHWKNCDITCLDEQFESELAFSNFGSEFAKKIRSEILHAVNRLR